MKWLGKTAAGLRSKIAQGYEWLQNGVKKSPWSKHNLRRIQGLSPDEFNHLVHAGVADQDTLQGKLDGYVGSAVGDLASTIQLEKSRLVTLLLASLELWSKPSFLRWLGRHWADWVLIGAIILMAWQVFCPPERAYRVVAAREIPVLHQIQPEDLKEEPAPGQIGETLRQYTGRYTTSSVRKGQGLSSSDLSTGLSSLRIEIKNSAVPANPAQPQVVSLVFSARRPPADGTAIPALLLKIEDQGSTRIADLQIASGQQAEAAKWLGSADAYILLRLP